jgi:hypothetical protein
MSPARSFVVQAATLGTLGQPGAEARHAVVRDHLIDGEACRSCVGELVIDGLLGCRDACVEDGRHRSPVASVVMMSTQ